MDTFEAKIKELEQKINKLIERNKELEAVQVQLEEEIKGRIATQKGQNEVIKQLEDKNKLLKITKTLELGKDPINAKFKINEMLREIDKCIALLDK